VKEYPWLQFEQSLSQLETRLDQLATPLLGLDADQIGLRSAHLQQAFVDSAGVFRAVKLDAGRVPDAMVLRLRSACEKVIALREALSRMTASIDRALEVLIPQHATPVYGRYPVMPLACAGRYASYSA